MNKFLKNKYYLLIMSIDLKFKIMWIIKVNKKKCTFVLLTINGIKIKI